MKPEKTEILEAIEDLEANGYSCRFVAVDGKLKCLESGDLFSPEALTVDCVQRYEGTKDADDQMVIYAVTDKQGTKGLIIDSYGVYADADLADCIVKLQMGDEKMGSAERPLKDEVL